MKFNFSSIIIEIIIIVGYPANSTIPGKNAAKREILRKNEDFLENPSF